MQHSQQSLPNSHSLNFCPIDSQRFQRQNRWRNFLKVLRSQFAAFQANQAVSRDSIALHKFPDHQIDSQHTPQIYAQRLQDTWIYGHSHLVNDCKITKPSSPNLLIPDLKRLEGGWSHNGLYQWR